MRYTPHLTAPDRPAMEETTALRPSPELVRAAFRELHGRHLHGFALLLTLGDRPRAAHLAADALAAGVARASELRHPERGAAWLRAHVVRHSARGPWRRANSPKRAHQDDLDDLGVGYEVLAGLRALDLHERALIVAETLEGLTPLDVATVTGVDGRRLARLRQRARVRYATGFAAACGPESPRPTGPVAARIRASLGGAWR